MQTITHLIGIVYYTTGIVYYAVCLFRMNRKDAE